MTALPRTAQELFARSFGHGARDLLAAHCTLAHSGAWRGLASAMRHEVTITAFDMLSHGRSPDWDGQGDIQDRMTAAAEPFLTGPMDVIGHSFGATVALRLAVAHPERIRSLTLVEPVFMAVAAADDPEKLAQHERDLAPFEAAIEAGDHALAARVFNRMWSHEGPKWPEMPESTRAAMTRAISIVPACRPSLYDDRAGLLEPGVLGQVRAPCLLLRGGHTHPVIGAINDGLAKRLPDAQSRVVAEAGHMLPLTHPEALAEEMRALFARAPV